MCVCARVDVKTTVALGRICSPSSVGREKPTVCTMSRWRERECVYARAHQPSPVAASPGSPWSPAHGGPLFSAVSSTCLPPIIVHTVLAEGGEKGGEGRGEGSR